MLFDIFYRTGILLRSYQYNQEAREYQPHALRKVPKWIDRQDGEPLMKQRFLKYQRSIVADDG